VPLALSTGHEVGLGVTALVFIIWALASSFLFPRIWPDYPGNFLPAFLVISLLFFFGMLTAVENFGAEEAHGEAAATEETTSTVESTTTTTAPTTTAAATTTAAQTTTAAPKPAAQTVQATETEFKIALSSTSFKAGTITFDVKNEGKIEHDLAVKGTSFKTKLIPPGGTAEVKATLKPGTYEVYCTVPGHEQAGMKINITVT
jgi:uncharacterized cupredoxin-like copper-binding protein